MERGLYQGFDKDNDKKNYLEKLNYSQLVNFLVQFLTSTTPNNYSLDSSVILYIPHSKISGQEIIPSLDYNFQIPATIHIRLTNKQEKQTLTFSFFPIRYSYYQDHSELTGSSPDDAKEILNERYRDGRKTDHINQIVEQAKKTMVNPFFAISLEKDGSIVTSVRVDFPQQNQKGKLYLLALPSLAVNFSPYNTDKISKVDTQNPFNPILGQIARDFLAVTKNFLKARFNNKNKKR